MCPLISSQGWEWKGTTIPPPNGEISKGRMLCSWPSMPTFLFASTFLRNTAVSSSMGTRMKCPMNSTNQWGSETQISGYASRSSPVTSASSSLRHRCNDWPPGQLRRSGPGGSRHCSDRPPLPSGPHSRQTASQWRWRITTSSLPTQNR